MRPEWLHGLAGGTLIGLAATLLMLLAGRIAGVSGIVAGCFERGGGWRVAFVLGLVAAPLLAAAAGVPLIPPQMPASFAVTVAAGLLVGFGSRLGAGCTSGHGVCGLARLSPRSLVATTTFMVAAAAVVAVVRHGIGG